MSLHRLLGTGLILATGFLAAGCCHKCRQTCPPATVSAYPGPCGPEPCAVPAPPCATCAPR